MYHLNYDHDQNCPKCNSLNIVGGPIKHGGPHDDEKHIRY